MHLMHRYLDAQMHAIYGYITEATCHLKLSRYRFLQGEIFAVKKSLQEGILLL